jgi:ATP-binding cassette subfamily F protein 3
MSILTANNLGVSFGAFDLFKGIHVTIANDSKIGLIGPNGIGKTTLLMILAGINQPTTGSIHLARGHRLGYLRQEAVDAFAERTNAVYTEMQAIFAHLQEKQQRLHEMERCMENGEYSDELLETYGDLQQKFEHAGGYDYELRIQQTLQGLGLDEQHWHMPLNHLSGGQKTRALLARLLLEKPDILMLDEPTNHLDIEAVEWLEHTLKSWDGAVLIVSHDRYFLDNTVNTIWEMSVSGLETFAGNYSDYLMQRQDRWEYYERVFSEEKNRLLKQVDFIQRNWVRASTHARALGLLRRLSRDLAIVENFGIMGLRNGQKWHETGLSVERPLDVVEAVRKVNAIEMTMRRPPAIRPRLPAAHNSGNMVLRLENAAIGYPRHKLFSAAEAELRRGDCAALIGPNGSGKTTFLKVLLGQLKPLKGEVRLGSSLKIGYFAQAHDTLQGDHTVLDELLRHRSLQPGEARSYLAPYLFTGEDVFKPISALSGGERARLALAILALEGSNLLLLDEPTNHLDMPAREALQEVLEAYSGTIILVSHDRYLIDRLANQIWEIRDDSLFVFQGPYREFILRGLSQREIAHTAPAATRQVLLPKPQIKGDSHAARKRIEMLATVEDRIHEQETIIQRLSREIQKAGEGKSFDKVHKLSWKVAQAQNTLEDLLTEWERLAT